MTFGKFCGCLICLTSFADNKYKGNPILEYILDNLNNLVVLILTFIGYGISCFYIIKSQNFRIKAIARIMRKSELETNIY